MKAFKKFILAILLLIVPIGIFSACNKSVEFKINFIVDNEVYDTISTTGNTTISMPDDPIKEGYTFDGWYWDNDVWSKPFTANSLLDTPLVKDLRVYAKFNIIHTHSIVVIDAVEPTCSSSGNQKYYKCSTCNKLFSDETATTEITQIPVLAKLSHISGNWQITKTATCTLDGLKIKKCTLCGETLQNEIINATGHTPSAWNITKQPTCTEYGTKIKTCTTCNAVVESENINPNGHVYNNWIITKQPTYTELGQEKRTCQNCSHYETRNIPTLTPTYVEPTSLILENGILKWNGSSPFGFELIVNNQSYIVQDNQFETTLKSDDYNSAKVACIYVDNTKSTYIELNNFIVNAPITNLHFVDDGTNVKFTWDSPSDLYDYTFIYNNTEKTVSKTQHYYSVPRNQLQKGTEISIFVQGLSSANFYPSKKYTITLEQLDAPNLKINKLNVEWDNILNAQEYKVQALTTLTQTSTTYNYDGANDGEYTITVTAFGADYLNNSATLTFTKLKKPTINIEDNIVTWDAIAGQVRYAVLIDDVETKFIGNSYTIQNTNSEYNIYLYASPVQPNTMQSDRVIISKFTYEQYSSVYYGSIVGDTLNYFNVVDQTILYVPDKIIDSCNFSSFKSNAILIASKVPNGLNKQYISQIIVPNGIQTIPEQTFESCNYVTKIFLPDSLTTIGANAFANCSKLMEIIIPNNVTSIGENAFSGCSSLTKITIPFVGNGSDKTHFGYIFGASKYDSNSDYVPKTLKEVVITGSNNISNYAFDCCSNLTAITIPSSVTSIGNYAFSGCTKLTEIIIPDSVTSIGNYAFYKCSNITSITILDSVTSIGNSAFETCSSLTRVNITNLFRWIEIDFGSNDANPLYYAKNLYLNNELVEDIVIPKEFTKINAYAFYNAECLKMVTFEEGSKCERIGSSSFSGCLNLTNIIIPDSVTSIGNYAFEGCSSLTRVNITNLSRWIEIDFGSNNANPLYYAKNLYLNNELVEDIVIPKEFTKINAYAFYNAECLKTVTFENCSKCESIGSGAFSNCLSLTRVNITNLSRWLEIDFGDYAANPLYYTKNLYLNNELINFENVIIPKDVKKIGSYVLNNFTNLKTISFEEESVCESIGCCAFGGCSSLTKITIPDSVTSIHSYAFNKCSSLTEIIIPSSVTSIGNSAFRNCSSLTKITIPFVGNGSGETHFGYIFGASNYNYNFGYVPNALKEVVITGGNSISYDAFYECSNITSITIPDSVTSIGNSAFSYCSKLTEITIPDSVTSIGNSAFRDCSSLTKIALPFIGNGSDKTYFGYIFGASSYAYNSGYVPETLKEVVITGSKSIGNYAFYECSNITSIKIPNSVTNIGNYAFSDTNLIEITIPDSVTSIGGYAFADCTSLTKITLPFIGNGSDKTHFGYIFGASSYDYNYKNVPNTLREVIITGSNSISNYAFYNCSNIASLTIPSSVTSIGNYAFFGCSNLIEIIIPNSVTSIRERAFSGCSSLAKIIVDENNRYYDSRENCNAIIETKTNKLLAGCKNTTIPLTVTSIGNYAFSNCSSLTSITIPNSITSIGYGTFKYCTSLTKITLPFVGNGSDKTHFGYIFGADTSDDNSKYVPSTLKEVVITGSNSISYDAFYECSNLTEIIIPNSVTSIGYQTFSGCSNLTKVTIPSSVTSIGDSAFHSCSSLTSIIILDSVISIGSCAFSNCSSLTIYCEITSKPDTWDSGWNKSNRPVYWYSETVPARSGNYWHYVDGEVKKW